MRSLNPSIRTQLLCWLVIPILVLLFGSSVLTYGLAVNLAEDAYDRALLDQLHSVANCISLKDNVISVDLPPAALSILKDDNKDATYYQVVDTNGKMIAGDTEVPLPVPEQRETFRDDEIAGKDVRIAQLCIPIKATKPATYVYIQVAETVRAREQIGRKIVTGVLLPQLAMLALSVLVVYFGVSKGLAPVRALRDAVASRTILDLRPIPVANVPKEVRPLVKAINDLLERLGDDLQSQRRFTANAAHQLRTPIAGLKMQAELALRQRDQADVHHALTLIHTAAERAARLANQLLALARSEPGAIDPALWRTVDLRDIARHACKQLVAQAIARKIDLGFEADPTLALVKGDEASLLELASNLIENAVLYTEPGGWVNVNVQKEPDSDNVRLIVEDNGAGIPEAERGKVFERFYRLLDRKVSGSGLGLAIVREIADAHKATVQMDAGPNGRGLRVTVEFPPVKSGEKIAALEQKRELVTR